MSKFKDGKLIGDFKTLEINKESWHSERKNYVGGSDVYVLMYKKMGLEHKWATPFMLYVKKKFGVDFTKMNEDIQRGVERESKIRESIPSAIEYPFLLVHNQYDFIRANIDGLIVDGDNVVGLEIKSLRKMFDEVPPYYFCQCQYYMGVTGLNEWHLYAECGSILKKFEIKRDQEFIDKMFSAVVSFWENHVISGVSPEPDFVDIEKPYIDYCFSEIIEEKKDLSSDFELLEEYKNILIREKEIQKRKDYLSLRIKYLVGNSLIGDFGSGQVKIRRQSMDKFNSSEFKKQNADEYEKFVTKTSYSIITVLS